MWALAACCAGIVLWGCTSAIIIEGILISKANMATFSQNPLGSQEGAFGAHRIFLLVLMTYVSHVLFLLGAFARCKKDHDHSEHWLNGARAKRLLIVYGVAAVVMSSIIALDPFGRLSSLENSSLFLISAFVGLLSTDRATGWAKTGIRYL